MYGTTYKGLCSTCKHASLCTLPRDPRIPLLYCEEFEIEVTTPRKTSLGDVESHVADVEKSSPSMGLCFDCENAQTCVFQKREGGVWHCEEYR